MSYEDRNKQNLKTFGILMGLVVLMVGMAFASVPLYNLFCKFTGYGGTTGESVNLPGTVLDREVTVRFNTDTARNMPWIFKAEQDAITVKLGQGALISFYAENMSNHDVVGTAIYNVTPNKIGKYFKKIQCFCFDRQVLKAGESVHMPVYFYVDPALNEDDFAREVKTITLSYSFFEADSDDLDAALTQFYESN